MKKAHHQNHKSRDSKHKKQAMKNNYMDEEEDEDSIVYD